MTNFCGDHNYFPAQDKKTKACSFSTTHLEHTVTVLWKVHIESGKVLKGNF